MNYYSFHISDFALHTSHLTVEEEGVYRRLLDFYYDTEQPIPKETQPVIRRLRLGSHSETVASILEEFFILKPDGWHNLRADLEIADYQKKGDTARENGKKGGRPKKNGGTKTQLVSVANPDQTQTKANQEPITKNQEPSKGAEPEVPRVTFTDQDMEFTERFWRHVQQVAPKTKTPNLERWAETVRLMRERDDLAMGEIVQVFEWLTKDSFWSGVIFSIPKFREKFAVLHSKTQPGGSHAVSGSGYQSATERADAAVAEKLGSIQPH